MNAKAQIVVKPTQSGKTFTMLTKIVDLFKENEESETRRIQLIFVDNSLLQASQLASRVRDCEWFENDQNEYLMFSSNSRTSNLSAIMGEIAFPRNGRQVHNIIMCANNYRFKDAIEIINRANTINFDIWIDESDKTFASTNHTIIMNTLCGMNNVKNITLLTATPCANLRQFYSGIRIYAMENTTIEGVYTSWNESIICHHDHDCIDAVNYARSVLNRFSKCFEGDVKCFIPADFYVETHEAMAYMLIERRFTVLIINGSTCVLTYKLGKQIVRCDALKLLRELNADKYANGLDDISPAEWIGDIYADFVSGPFAITGNLCINRGTTLSSAKMCINRAIMPPKQPKSGNQKEFNMASMYQLAGRICGNTMEFKDWQPPMVFCTSIFDSCIKVMEDRAKRLAEVCYENGQTIVTAEDYETIAGAPKTNAEKDREARQAEMELRGTVPTILHIDDELHNQLIKRHGDSTRFELSELQRRQIILNELSKQNTEKRKEIMTCKFAGMIVPRQEETINRLIDIPIQRNTNNIKWKAWLSAEHCKDNVWAAFVHPTDPIVVICAYFGRRHMLIEDI
jgi:hypothetical protein